MTYLFEKFDYSMFENRFRDYDRLDNFRLGLRDLFNHLQDLAEDTGEPIEIDVIAICCDYSEIKIKDINRETGCESLDDLRDNTMVIEVDDDTIIYQVF